MFISFKEVVRRIFVLFLPVAAFAQVTITGDISGTYSPGAGTYSVAVGQSVSVAAGDTLILLPGTHLELWGGHRFLIEGVVIALGQEELPITINSTAGKTGIRLNGSGELIGDHVHFSDIGRIDEGSQGQIYSFLVTDSASLELDNSLIKDSYGNLFNLHSNGRIRVTNSVFQDITNIFSDGNLFTAKVRNTHNNPILLNNTFSTADSVINGIFLDHSWDWFEDFDRDEYVFEKTQIPYIIDGFGVDHPIRIEAGVIIKIFNAGFGNNGSTISINGLDGDPVIITSIYDSTRGGTTWLGSSMDEEDWNWMISVNAYEDGDVAHEAMLTVNHAEIAYGSLWISGKEGTGTITNSIIHAPFHTPINAEEANVSVNNNSFTALPSPLAIVAVAENCAPVFEDNLFETAERDALVIALSLHMGYSGEQYTFTIPSSEIPWYLEQINGTSPCSLTVEGNNVLLIENGIDFYYPAHFEINGTEQEPVYVTTLYDNTFGLGGEADNKWWGIGFDSGIDNDRFSMNASYTMFVNIDGDGMDLRGDNTHVNLQNCIFAFIEDFAIVTNDLMEGSSVVVNHTNFINCGGGINNLGDWIGWEESIQIDARNCYWDHASGPEHETINPSGEGLEVRGDVLIDPWWINTAGNINSVRRPAANRESGKSLFYSMGSGSLVVYTQNNEPEPVQVTLYTLKGSVVRGFQKEISRATPLVFSTASLAGQTLILRVEGRGEIIYKRVTVAR